MFKRLFGKKRAEDSLKELNKSMSKVDRDIYLIQQWINHLHEKGEEVRTSHFQHIELTRKDIANINKWMQYLHAHNLEMHKFVKETSNRLAELHQNHANMIKRIEKIEQGQLRTSERTTQGQIEDMSLKIRTPEIKKKVEFIEPLAEAITSIETTQKIIKKSEFNGSQIELLNVLYHADRPLDYDEIARILKKKEKSVRNLIYELREGGVVIKARPVGPRKKGFFLDKEEKIKVSGR